MSEYWKSYWDRHVEQVASDDPFRQVLRVQNKQPLSEALFRKIVAYLIDKLEVEASLQVLDLCCGNGLISAEIAAQCQQVTGVDFSEKLIEDLRVRAPANVTGIVGDVLEVTFPPASFHRILFAAALQHFSQAEVIRLFTALARWLKPSGVLLITDILDARRMWDFYNSAEREDVYFQHTMEGTPILGTWFDRVWLEKLAYHAGFRHAQALDQPDAFLYSHYRFDLLCRT